MASDDEPLMAETFRLPTPESSVIRCSNSGWTKRSPLRRTRRSEFQEAVWQLPFLSLGCIGRRALVRLCPWTTTHHTHDAIWNGTLGMELTHLLDLTPRVAGWMVNGSPRPKPIRPPAGPHQLSELELCHRRRTHAEGQV
jgi:hypothetical protein